MIYIVDDILLFNPKIDENHTVYRYKDINNISPKRCYVPVICFITGDIKSVYWMTDKMLMMFSTFKSQLIILKDGTNTAVYTYFHLVKSLLKREVDRKNIPQMIKGITNDLKRIEENYDVQKVNFTYAPLYLKTTMCYGIQSGGAVAHATGVVKSLKKKYPKLSVYTTDYFPKEISRKLINTISMERFHDFYDENKLNFNNTVYKYVCNNEKNSTFSFIYQRYELYDFSGLKLAEKFSIPFVLEWNGSALWLGKNWDNLKLKYKKIAQKIEMLNLDKASLIVCVSDELKKTLVDNGIKSEKILVNYNGVDERKYNPHVSGMHIKNKLNIKERMVIGFCGSFTKFHGAEKLAEAYGRILQHNEKYKDNVCLLMIGEGNTLPEVKRILKRYKVYDSVRCVGSVPFEQMPEYLAACDILVAPHVRNKDGSEFFGSPTKLFEYMAMGKAIVASNLNQIGDILSNNTTALLVEPENIEDMENAIVRLIENDELRMQLGKEARKEVVKKYTWDKHVEKILDYMEQLSLKGVL